MFLVAKLSAAKNREMGRLGRAQQAKTKMRLHFGKSARPENRLALRRAEQGQPPRPRFARWRTIGLRLKTVRQALFSRASSRVLFEGAASPESRVLNQIAQPRLKIPTLLNVLHQQTGVPHASSEERRIALASHLAQLGDSDLYRLRRKLSTRRMLNVRAALLAADKAGAPAAAHPSSSDAAGRQFVLMGGVLDEIDKMVTGALNARGYDFAPQRPLRAPPKKGAIPGALNAFRDDLAAHFTAGQEDLPAAEKAGLQELASRLAGEAPDAAALADPENLDFDELAVTKDFLSHCAGRAPVKPAGRQAGRVLASRAGLCPKPHIELAAAGQSQNLAIEPAGELTGDDEEQNRQISAQVLRFTNGNAEQALRLSHLMNADLAQQLAGIPFFGRQPSPGWLSLPLDEATPATGELRLASETAPPHFRAERLADGSIKLNLRVQQNLHNVSDITRDGSPVTRFDPAKSTVVHQAGFLLTPQGTVRLTDTARAYRVFRQGGRLLPALAARAQDMPRSRWMRPV